MKHIATILSVRPVLHNVKEFRLSKPPGYHFEPGQATEISINKEGWRDRKNPFTFTCLNTADYLEFTIKIYPDHQGVTNELDQLRPGDELILRDVWGAIQYRGPGCFIAGGAGITPFLAILRHLQQEGKVAGNELFFSNKTQRDIILQEELTAILGPQAHYVLTGEGGGSYRKGRIDKAFLQAEIQDFSRPFYVCGPDKMVSSMVAMLQELGADPDAVVIEQ